LVFIEIEFRLRYDFICRVSVEDDNKKAKIESCQVLITATPEEVKISTLDYYSNPKQTITFDGDNFTIQRDVNDK
jgi:hypothetical protein